MKKHDKSILHFIVKLIPCLLSLSLFVYLIDGNYTMNVNCIYAFFAFSSQILDKFNTSERIHFALFPSKYIQTNYTIYVHQNYTVPPAYILDKDDKRVPQNKLFGYQPCFQMKYNFYCLNNVYFAMDTQFYIDNGSKPYPVYYLDAFGHGRYFTDEKIVKHYATHAIALAATGTREYGDMIMASFVRMAVFPRELYKYSKLIIQNNTFVPMFYEVLEVLNLPKCEMIMLNEYEVIYCSNLYTLLPYFKENQYWLPYCVHLNFFGPMMREFGDKMRKGFGVLEPYDYSLYNRFKGVRRSFENFDEIVDRVQKEYPEHNFTTIIGHYKTLKETARRYGVVKWLFAVAGSNSMNSIFMKARTCVCMYMANFYDSPAIGSIVGSEICIVAYMNPEQDFVGPPLVANLTRLMPFIKKSMEILETQRA